MNLMAGWRPASQPACREQSVCFKRAVLCYQICYRSCTGLKCSFEGGGGGGGSACMLFFLLIHLFLLFLFLVAFWECVFMERGGACME